MVLSAKILLAVSLLAAAPITAGSPTSRITSNASRPAVSMPSVSTALQQINLIGRLSGTDQLSAVAAKPYTNIPETWVVDSLARDSSGRLLSIGHNNFGNKSWVVQLAPIGSPSIAPIVMHRLVPYTSSVGPSPANIASGVLGSKHSELTQSGK